MPRKAFSLAGSAPTVGPFSLAVAAEPLLFLSGQLGLDPATNRLIAGGISAECAQIFRNLEAVLSSAGKSLDDVVKTTVYLADIADYGAMNEVYRGAFAAPYPARTAIAVAALPLGARVEIDVITH
jgi:2-iminobutanoate/2-iminopropanoate deaminase